MAKRLNNMDKMSEEKKTEFRNLLIESLSSNKEVVMKELEIKLRSSNPETWKKINTKLEESFFD